MRRRLITFVVSGWLACSFGAAVQAQQSLDPEAFRETYLGMLEKLETLPIMTYAFVADAQSDPAMRTQLASLAQLQSNLQNDLAVNKEAIRAYSTDDLVNLQLQLQAVGINWETMPDLLHNVVSAQHLALLDPSTPLNYPSNSCISNDDFTGVGALKVVALIVRIVNSQGCQAAQCGGPVVVAPCVVAGVARFAYVIADSAVLGSLRCHEQAFENEGERRLGVKVSTRAHETSVGVRDDCNTTTGRCARAPAMACTTDADCGDAFAAMDLHAKLQTRLDVKLSTRSTQDSVDGQREAPQPPSPDKSVRTVVDKTDEIVLPRLQRKMNQLNAAIAAQGSMLRDLQLLQMRFKISENLLQRHPRLLPVVLFQMPNTVNAPAKKFCSVSSTISCMTDGDCPPAVAGETCGPMTPPRTCSVSGNPCTDFFDCPVQPVAAEVCLPQPNPQAGLLQVASDIAQESIDMSRMENPNVGSSQINRTRGVADMHVGNYKQAYRHLRQSYRRAVRPSRAP